MVEQRVRKVTDPFQWRIFVRILSYGLIYQVTVWNLLFCWRLLHNQGSFLDQYREFFAEQYPILLCVLVLAPAFAWDAVKYCHRIAGPIYRFRATVKDIAADKPIKLVTLREGDELLGSLPLQAPRRGHHADPHVSPHLNCRSRLNRAAR